MKVIPILIQSMIVELLKWKLSEWKIDLINICKYSGGLEKFRCSLHSSSHSALCCCEFIHWNELCKHFKFHTNEINTFLIKKNKRLYSIRNCFALNWVVLMSFGKTVTATATAALMTPSHKLSESALTLPQISYRMH